MKYIRPCRLVGGICVEPLEARWLLHGLPWGPFAELIGQAQAVKDYPYLTGAGESIVVIDRGFDYDYSLLGGGIGPGFKVEAGYAFDTDTDTPTDLDGHGTGVAGILAANPYTFDGYFNQGVAPGANLIDLRQNSSATIQQALDWVIAHRVQYNIVAVNLTDFEGPGHDPTIYDSELQTLNEDGVFIAAPAGNDGADVPIEYPAADPYVYNAGGIDKHGVIAANVQRGPDLDVLAPGVNVTLTYYNVRRQQPFLLDYGTGSSWSSPYLAGTAALIKQVDPTLTPAQIMAIIQQSGHPTYDPVSKLTYPRLDIDAAIKLAYQERDGAYQGNDTFALAAPLKLVDGSVSLSDLKLLIGQDDYFSFKLGSAQNVSFDVNYENPPSAVTAQVMDSNGQVIAPLGASTIEHLAAGTYVLHFSAPQSLIGTYGFSIDDAGGTFGPGDPGSYSSLARGADGTLYLAYYDPASQTLKFSTCTDGVWSTPQTIDATAGVGQYVSLALDSAGLPGVAYYDAAQGNLRYAHYDGTTWEVQTLTSLGAGGDYPSLAFKDLDPTIAFHSAASHALELDSFRHGSWSISTIDSTGDPGYYTSLVADPVHGGWSVAYENNATDAFEYATQIKNKWRVTTVAASRTGGGYVSLAYNTAGEPAFSYYNAKQRSLQFAQNTGRSWSTATVQSARHDRLGQYSQLFFTPSDQAEILYYGTRANSVFAARGSIGNWQISTLEDGGGPFIALAAGAADNAFSWIDPETGDVQVDNF